MKKIIVLIILLTSILACKAQEGRIEALGSISRIKLPNGTYLKDMNDSMLHYIGTWKGIYGGKYIVLKIEKLTKKRNNRANGKYWYEDEMIGRYIVYSGDPDLPSTTIIATSMNQTNELTPLKSVGDGRNNEFDFAYDDYQFCGAEGQLILRRDISNPNKLTYRFSTFGKFIFNQDCPYDGTIPVPLPNAVIELTRAN